MIGQKTIQEKLHNYNATNFPKSNLVIGSDGSGKHLFVNDVSKKLGITVVDITNTVSKETIDEIYVNPEQHIYIIDINELAKKHRYLDKENVILKFVEEPPELSTICILAEHESQILDTIKNRCIMWKFEPYIWEELITFKIFDNLDIYKLVDTPGKLLESKEEKYYNELIALSNTIVNSIGRANISNTLSLEKYLGEDQYDLKLFLKSLCIEFEKEYMNTLDERLFNGFSLCKEYINRANILGIVDKNLFYSFILSLKKLYD